jgi:hypothetical protein
VIARRLLLLAAVLMLLTALAAGLAPRQEQTASPARTTLPAGAHVVKQIPADPSADSRVAVRRGDLLELEVTGATFDTVLIERLDRIDPIEPTTPARFNIVVDATAGTYPIRLVEADRRIGALVVAE